MTIRRSTLLATTAALLLGGLAVPSQAGTGRTTTGPGLQVRGPVLDRVLTAELAAARGSRTGLRATRIVFVHSATIDAAVKAVRTAKLTLLESYEQVGVAVAAGSLEAVARVAQDAAVTHVEAQQDAVRFGGDHPHVATRADEARDPAAKLLGKRRLPFDGTGITIAVNDSGIDGTHPMFVEGGVSKVVRSLRFVCVDLATTCDGFEDGPAVDGDGHGTAVAGIAAGYPRVTALGDLVRGVAPGAKLIALADNEYGFGYVSGLNWVLENHRDPCGDGSCPPIKVVTNSWGHLSDYFPNGGNEFDPQAAAAKLSDALVAAGVVVTFAMGNDGGDGTTRNHTLSLAKNPTPGVLGLANYDDLGYGSRDGKVESSSSRGFELDPTTYPDLSAPGSLVTTACSATQRRCQPSQDGTQYATLSGTSFSSPYAAGTAALLFQAEPSLTPADVEYVLEETAYQFGPGPYVSDPRHPGHTSSFDAGHGLIDVAAALATVLGRKIPADSCDGTAVITDPTGDATSVVLRTPLPSSASEPALDVVRAWITTAPDAALTFSVRVSDLGAQVSPTSPAEFLRWNFTFAGAGHELRMERTRQPAAPATRFYLLREGMLVVDGLSGRADAAMDLVTVTLPPDTLHRWNGTLPVLHAGDRLVNMTVISARAMPLAGTKIANLVADISGGPCPYVVGTATSGTGASEARPARR